jgi:protein-disulfide isomerase
MPLPSLRSPLLFLGLVAVLAASAGCKSASTSGAGPGSLAAKSGCTAASPTLPADTVVASLDGKAITVADLGKELASAEEKSLSSYCDAVHGARAQALDNYVTEKLVEKAASAAGKAPDDWMKEELDKKNPPPSDEAMKAFYDERKRPDAPPFDAVKEQVAAVMMREQAGEAVQSIVSDLKKGAKFEDKLPDVRPPPRDVDIAAHTARKGGQGAKVKVVEFADFQCPYCSRAAAIVRELHAKYGDRVEFAYRHFPLRQMHPDAQRAAEHAQCAQKQGKFWELHDKLYAAQDKLDEESIKGFEKELGLDETKLAACLSSGEAAKEVEADLQKAETLGLEGTPSFFVDGRLVPGASIEALTTAIDRAL